MNILIIDDERFFTCNLCALISKIPEMDCHTVYQASDALEAVRINHYDLVICDIRLGEKSGEELIPAEADSVRISVAGALSGEVLQYTALIDWTNPTLFGLNIDVSVSAPQNGLYYAAAETLIATVVFTNDNGDTMAVDDGANNKLEKFDFLGIRTPSGIQ